MNFDAPRVLIESAVASGDPGLAVGMYRNGQLVRSYVSGLASVEFDVPVDSSTRFDIASASKQFTAAAAYLLAMDGTLDLHADIRTYLDELRLGVPVTVQQCLHHTAGLPEWYALMTVAGLPFSGMTEDRVLSLLRDVKTTNFAPGSDFSYSNTGYILAAAIVRRVSGKSLAEFASERIFMPLGMSDTIFRDAVEEPLRGLAPGYSNDDGTVVRADTEESVVGDGGVVTSVADLAPWFGFLADGRGLGADLRSMLLERAVLDDGTILPYAGGIYHSSVAGQVSVGHSGGVGGYLANLAYFPEHDLGVAVLSNQTRVAPNELTARIAELVFDEIHASPTSEPAESPTTAPIGMWFDAASEEVVEVVDSERGRVEFRSNFGTIEFAHSAHGHWDGQGDAAGVLTLEHRGDVLVLGGTSPVQRPIRLVRCDDTPPSPLPDGIYRNEELNVLARIREGSLTLGLQLELPITPTAAGVSTAGPFSLRLEGEDLLLTTHGLRHLRFIRQPADTEVVGVPLGLIPGQ